MTVRELRNNLVFWLSLAGFVYLFAYELHYGVLITGCGAVVSAIASVVVVALVTDRFTGG